MRLIQSSPQRLQSALHAAALTRAVVAASAFAILPLSACSDGPFIPTERHIVASGPRAAVAPQHRPFQISQSWDPSGNDWTVPPCVVEVPNPASPGTTVQIVISRLLHSSGTATHFGRYTADNYAVDCTWDASVGAIDVGGWVRAVVASGDTVWGTWQSYATFGGTGADFDGVMWLDGGTGRFLHATGMASIHSHDEPDGSGSGSGSGWIAY
jgi:hypothetical protein